VRVSRCTGGGKRRMFGSSIRDHMSFITLEVKEGKRQHMLSQDWYSAAGGRLLLELHLSNAQFAELITTMNMGDGVPCTIRYLDGRKMEDPPDEETEVEKVQTGFKQDARKLAQKLDGFREEVRKLFEKKTIGKQDREEILKQIGLFIQEVHSDFPFVLQQFEEATERVVGAAKAEVDAFMTHAVTAAGVEALADGRIPKLLGGSEDDD